MSNHPRKFLSTGLEPNVLLELTSETRWILCRFLGGFEEIVEKSSKRFSFVPRNTDAQRDFGARERLGTPSFGEIWDAKWWLWPGKPAFKP